MENSTQKKQDGTNIVVNVHTNHPSNVIGTAGFVLALIGAFLGWVPILGWTVWFLGAILSVVGLFKKPKGLAIAGIIISFIGLILLIIFAIIIGTVATYLH